jgi:hypothetical protein
MRATKPGTDAQRWSGQAHAPAGLLDQLVGQVRRVAAGFQRSMHGHARRHGRGDLPPVILDLGVLHDLARFIHHADLHEVLVIIPTHQQPSPA